MHIMLDLETGATEPNAAIFQCAAVPFELGESPQPVDLYSAFNQYFADSQGFVDQETMIWWAGQGQAYHELVKGIARSLYSEKAALEHFIAWYKLTEKHVGTIQGLWSYGASFDIPIMKMAFQRHGLKYPWSYNVERCMDTVMELFGHTHQPFEGTKHNALADCVHQIAKMRAVL